MMNFKQILIIVLVLFTSCQKENKLKQAEIVEMATKWQLEEFKKEGVKEIEIPFLIAKSPKMTVASPSGINCPERYGIDCLSSFKIEVRKVAIIFVEFKTSLQAQEAARRLNQYVLANWLLDKVHGEPVLEDFALNVLKAKRP